MKPREIAALLRMSPPELNGTRRRLSQCFTVEDMHRMARRRLPRAALDFVDGGSDDELTTIWNREAFERIQFQPRILRDVSDVDTSVMVLGERLPVPLVLGPAGVVRFVHPAVGERAIVAAAGASGIPYVLPTMATTSIEDAAKVPGANLWFNLLIQRDRGLTKTLIERAKNAGYRVLVVTVDVPMNGSRLRELHAGVTMPPKVRPRTIAEGAMHPGWWMRFLAGEAFRYPNVSPNIAKPLTASQRTDGHFDASVTWTDIDWVRSIWDGPTVIKGIVAPEDAALAVSEGVDAIVVSNHGGRMLDQIRPTIEALPAIMDTVGDSLEVYLDSGVRRGSDIVKALAYGARACFVARPYFYGLATAGQAGVEHMIKILRTETARTLTYLGATSPRDLDRSYLVQKARP